MPVVFSLIVFLMLTFSSFSFCKHIFPASHSQGEEVDVGVAIVDALHLLPDTAVKLLEKAVCRVQCAFLVSIGYTGEGRISRSMCLFCHVLDMLEIAVCWVQCI